jgi:hypothetical protein
MINLLTQEDQNGRSWNWNSNICFLFLFVCLFVCVCNINMHISTEGHLEWAFGNDTLLEVDPRVDH